MERSSKSRKDRHQIGLQVIERYILKKATRTGYVIFYKPRSVIRYAKINLPTVIVEH